MRSLRWAKTQPGRWVSGAGNNRRYAIEGHRGWCLEVRDRVGGEWVTVDRAWLGSMREAKATAAAYHRLGEGYDPARHGGKSRMNRAIEMAGR